MVRLAEQDGEDYRAKLEAAGTLGDAAAPQTRRAALEVEIGAFEERAALIRSMLPEDGSEETRTSAGLASPAALLEQIEAMLRSDYAPIDRERLGVLQQRVEWATRMLDPRVWGRFAVFTAHNKH